MDARPFTRLAGFRLCGAKRWWLALFLGLLLPAHAQEALPRPPATYFTDTANVVPAATAIELTKTLADFERTSSSQLVVAIYRKLPPRTVLEEYANRLFRHWKIGETKKNNGVLLLIFTEDRKLRIEVGYGLEGALPDAVAKRIIENEITPQFRAGNYGGGVTAGVNAIIAATKGEYRGVGTTVAERSAGSRTGARLAVGGFLLFWILVFGGIIVFAVIWSARRGVLYRSGGTRSWYDSGSSWSSWSSGNSGGGSSSDSGSSSSSFSGGGGDSGGGGASGSW